MGFEKTGRTGLGDNAQPESDEEDTPITPPAQPVPPVKKEQED